MTAWKQRVLIYGGLLLAVLAAPVWMFYRLDLDDPFDDSAFDRNIWLKHANYDNDNPRGHMVESLIDHLEDSRPTRVEVIQLLGPSESECSRLEPPVGSTETCLSYELGSWSGFRMDPDTLDVYFGTDGRFLEALPVQH